MASEDEIAFENACVVTPANATLVRDLTLRVPAGTNLLVTGPNGSGMHRHSRVDCKPHEHVVVVAERRERRHSPSDPPATPPTLKGMSSPSQRGNRRTPSAL